MAEKKSSRKETNVRRSAALTRRLPWLVTLTGLDFGRRWAGDLAASGDISSPEAPSQTWIGTFYALLRRRVLRPTPSIPRPSSASDAGSGTTSSASKLDKPVPS